MPWLHHFSHFQVVEIHRYLKGEFFCIPLLLRISQKKSMNFLLFKRAIVCYEKSVDPSGDILLLLPFHFHKDTISPFLDLIQNEAPSLAFLCPFSLASCILIQLLLKCATVSLMILKPYYFHRFVRSLTFDFKYPRMSFMIFFSLLMLNHFFLLSSSPRFLIPGSLWQVSVSKSLSQVVKRSPPCIC